MCVGWNRCIKQPKQCHPLSINFTEELGGTKQRSEAERKVWQQFQQPWSEPEWDLSFFFVLLPLLADWRSVNSVRTIIGNSSHLFHNVQVTLISLTVTVWILKDNKKSKTESERDSKTNKNRFLVITYVHSLFDSESENKCVTTNLN